MPERPPQNADTATPTDERNPIDAIAESFVQRLRQGEYPPISEYIAQHPDLEGEIRDVFPTLAMLEKCGEREGAGEMSYGLHGSPSRLGDYRIIREVARGGMGIVYEAEHDTMRRRVALKVLPTTLASSATQLHRFHREARAAGRLHHTNIVPVFEVGTDRGLHYYAMQFIQGQSLDVVFDELKRMKFRSTEAAVGADAATLEARRDSQQAELAKSIASNLLSGNFQPSECSEDSVESDAPQKTSESTIDPHANTVEAAIPIVSSPAATSTEINIEDALRSTSSGLHETSDDYYHRIARIGLQAAEATAFAHSQGVLHRDIKPANIILDASGVAWLTDFGLAKNEEGNLTNSGDIVGTLRYMAPERFSGHSDVRTDIYGLGVTLYELATLKVAFPQSDRANLIRVITHEDPERPRRVDRRIPRDLETIVLKAIDRQPQRRYQTAEDLAADLRRFLSDRPIAARRSSSVERAWRLCRRNPVAAMLSACLVVLLMVVVVGSLWFGYVNRMQSLELSDSIQTAQQAERDARESERKATSHFYELLVGRAESGRWSGRVGQRFDSLNSIAQAAELLPGLNLVERRREKEKLKLRNLAVSSMALVDLRLERSWSVDGDWTSISAISETGDWLAVGDKHGNIHVIDAKESGSLDKTPLRRILPSIGQQAWDIRISRDEAYLAAKYHSPSGAAQSVFVVWSIETGQPVFKLESNDLYFTRHQFSNDSQLVAVGKRSGEVEVFRIEDGSLVASLRVGYDALGLDFNDSATKLAVGGASNSEIQIWDLQASPPAKVRTLDAGASVTALAWRTENNRLAAGTSVGDVVAWDDPLTIAEPIALSPHKSRVTRVGLSHDGQLLGAYGWDGVTRIYDLRNRELVLRIDGYMLLGSGFGGDGIVGLELENSEIGIWRLPRDRPFKVLASNARGRRGDVVFHPSESRLLATPASQGVELWDVKQEKILHVIPSQSIPRLRFTPAGDALLTGDKNGLQRWPLTLTQSRTGNLSVTVGEPEQLRKGRSERMWFDSGGDWLAIDSGNAKPRLISLRSGDDRQVGSHPGLDHVCLTPDGSQLITSTWHGRGIRVWEVATGKLMHTLAMDWQSTSIALSPSGDRLAASSGQERAVWTTKDWSQIRFDRRTRADNWPGPVAFSRDGQLLANAKSRYMPQIQRANQDVTVAVLDAPKAEGVDSFSFSAGDRYLAVKNGDRVYVWDLELMRSRLTEMNLDWKDE